MSIHFKDRNKKDTGLCFTVPLHKGFGTFIHLLPKSRRHLGSYQRKAEAIKLTVFSREV